MTPKNARGVTPLPPALAHRLARLLADALVADLRQHPEAPERRHTETA